MRDGIETEVEDTSPVDATPQETDKPDFEREVSSLKNKNSELLNDLAKLKQFRNSVDELGGLDAFKEVMTSQKNAKMKQVEDSGDIQAIKRQYQDEVSTLQNQIKQLKTGMVDSQMDLKLRQAVEAAGGTWEFVEPVVKKRVQAEIVDEQLTYSVLDDTGHTWIKDGRDANLDDLVDNIRKDPLFGKAFDTKVNKTGSGATNSRRRPEDNPWLGEHRNLDAQTKMWLDNPDKARRMMADAGVAVARR